MEEQLLDKIRTIVDNEKFKMDAFFLCGAATGTPNKKLLKACENYLKAAETDIIDKAVVEELIGELETAVKSKKEVLGVNTANTNTNFIKEVLDNKDALLNK